MAELAGLIKQYNQAWAAAEQNLTAIALLLRRTVREVLRDITDLDFKQQGNTLRFETYRPRLIEELKVGKPVVSLASAITQALHRGFWRGWSEPPAFKVEDNGIWLTPQEAAKITEALRKLLEDEL
jgi:hypothetical protein